MVALRGGGLGPEGGALMNGTGVPYKGDPQSSLAPSTMGGHREKVPAIQGGGSAPDTESVGTLILNVQPPTLKINVCCL